MKTSTFEWEKKLFKKGYEIVVGIDEAGRGPLAGPVVASAVFLKNQDLLADDFDEKELNTRPICPAQDKKTLKCYSKAFWEAKPGTPEICTRPCKFEKQIEMKPT